MTLDAKVTPKRRVNRKPGQIVPSGERKWLVRVFRGRDSTGKRQYEGYTVLGTKKDAERYLRGVLLQIDMGEHMGVQHTLVGTLLDDVLADYKINGQGIEEAEDRVRVHLRPFFGALKASDLGTELIRKYIEHRQRPEKPDRREYVNANGKKHERTYAPASNATVNRELALLRRALNLGVRATPPKVGRVPFIPMLGENNVRKGFFEHDAFLALRMALTKRSGRWSPSRITPVVVKAKFWRSDGRKWTSRIG
jgi:hypothetical protein